MATFKAGDLVKKKGSDCCSADGGKQYSVRLDTSDNLGIGADETNLCHCDGEWDIVVPKETGLSTYVASEVKRAQIIVGKDYRMVEGNTIVKVTVNKIYQDTAGDSYIIVSIPFNGKRKMLDFMNPPKPRTISVPASQFKLAVLEGGANQIEL